MIQRRGRTCRLEPRRKVRSRPEHADQIAPIRRRRRSTGEPRFPAEPFERVAVELEGREMKPMLRGYADGFRFGTSIEHAPFAIQLRRRVRSPPDLHVLQGVNIVTNRRSCPAGTQRPARSCRDRNHRALRAHAARNVHPVEAYASTPSARNTRPFAPPAPASSRRSPRLCKCERAMAVQRAAARSREVAQRGGCAPL